MVLFQSFTDNSRRGIVERLVQCAHRSMHLAEAAAASGSSRFRCAIQWTSET